MVSESLEFHLRDFNMALGTLAERFKVPARQAGAPQGAAGSNPARYMESPLREIVERVFQYLLAEAAFLIFLPAATGARIVAPSRRASFPHTFRP